MTLSLTTTGGATLADVVQATAFVKHAGDARPLRAMLSERGLDHVPVVLTRGEGVWVWDVEGRRFMDCLAAYSAVNQGHCHPRLVKALVEQSCRVALTSRAFRNDQLGPLCHEVAELTGFARMLPMNSGAEAVEAAVRLAWVDVINAADWLLIVVLLEAEVLLQLRGKLTDGLIRGRKAKADATQP